MFGSFQEIVGTDRHAFVADAEIGIKRLKRNLSFAVVVVVVVVVVVEVVEVGKGVWDGIVQGEISFTKRAF